jgi:Dolichyl-phosphate-mannose-protein mannosyltransferase
MRALLSRHGPLVLVLAAATLVRAAVSVAYHPALFYTDSWAYVRTALGRPILGMAADRPSGYPALLRVLSLDGTTIDPVPIVQHLAGLVTGVLVYALLYRLGVRRWIATAVAAIVLLEAYAIALEQHVMAETFATLALTASVFLLVDVDGPSRPKRLAVSGLLLAVAIGTRTAAAFAVPAWIVYLLWAHRGLRPVLAAAAALVLPLLVYSTLHAAVGKGFGMGQADGWFLYGRVGPIVNCEGVDVPAGTDDLCRGPRPDDPDWYVWNASPAIRRFGGPGEGDAGRSNRLLRDFSLAIIAARPGAYLEAVGGDLADFVTTGGRRDPAILLPHGRPRLHSREDRDAWFPRLRTRTRWPAGIVRAYHDVAHLRGWILLPFALLSFASLALASIKRPSGDLRPRETFLLLGVAAGMLVGSTATVGGLLRYLIPTLPFLAAAGGLAASGLLARLSSRFGGRPPNRTRSTVAS